MTISMTMIETIRHLDDAGVSRRTIVRRLDVSRTTVDKYANQQDFSPRLPRKVSRPKARVLTDDLRGVLDLWLDEDQRKPRKQRHSATRLFQRLVDEHGYTGSYSPVQRYTKQWKQDHAHPGDGFLELSWQPGVIQVDFGQAEVILAGENTVVYMLVVTFPYSNMRLCRCFSGQTAECVITGLIEVIDTVGGVPVGMVFDNATAIGRRMGDSVVESELFAAITSPLQDSGSLL